MSDRFAATPDSRTEFIDRLRERDESAFADLVKRETPRLLAVAHRIVGCEETARDVVQETFISAFRHIDTFRGQCALSTWLYRIAINCSLMHLRKRRRRRELPLKEWTEETEPVLEVGLHVSDPEELSASSDLAARVVACMESLPDAYRVVLTLRDVDELDTREAAEVLGITPDAVKTRLYRARQALRKQMASHLEPLPVAAG